MKIQAIAALKAAGFEKTGLGWSHPHGWYCEVREDGRVTFPARREAGQAPEYLSPWLDASAVADAAKAIDDAEGAVNEFRVWTMPATMGAVRVAQERMFEPAHYDAAEREARRMGHDCITRGDVMSVVDDIDAQECAICGTCGRFHAPPACGAQ